jgi:hypothetical protein
VSHASRDYGEGRDTIPAIDEPTVIFIFDRSLPKDSWTNQDIYDRTRCSWKIGAFARERAVYALGASHGVVRSAYRIDRWTEEDGRRWCFEGRPAPEIGVVGTSIARLKARQGAANPVRLFLDGIPAATPNERR